MAGGIDLVEVQGSVLLRIVQHCRSSLPLLVQGQLLGSDSDGTLQVTHSFPFAKPNSEEEEDEADSSQFQMDMMRCLQAVNVDSNVVGWYTSANLGAIWTDKTISTQYEYQMELKKSVLLVYDTARSQQGHVSLKAFRLTDAFMELYQTGKFTVESMTEAGVGSGDIYESIPIKFANCLLNKALLAEFERRPDLRCDKERLTFSSHPYLERTMEMLLTDIDSLEIETKKLANYNRNVAKAAYMQSQQLAKRRAENALRKERGEEEIPEDDIVNSLKSVVQEPPRLDSLLISSQVGAHCTQLNQFAGIGFTRLFLASKFLGQTI